MIKRPFPAYRGTEPFVFASYAHSDAEAVYLLLTGLKEHGTHVWYDEGIEPGNDWRGELAAAIDGSLAVLFFVSGASVASRNCLKEINFALSRGKRVVLVYLEEAQLPAGLELSLGDEQGIVVAHHSTATVLDKMQRAVRTAPEPAILSGSAVASGKSNVLWPLWVFLAVAVVAFGWWQVATRSPGFGTQVEERVGPAVIAVATFANLSGKPDVDWLGDGVASLVSDQLAGSRHAVLVSKARLQNLTDQAHDPAAVRKRAQAAGIDYLVSGEMLPSPEGLLLSVRTTDLNSGINVGAQAIDALTRETLVPISQQVVRNIMQTLNLPRENVLETLSADFAADNFAAYEAYLTGLGFYNRFDYDQAAVSMQAALAISPDFHMANFRLANIQMSRSQWQAAQQTLARIPKDAQLPTRERAYVDGLGHMLAGEYPQAIQLFSARLEQAPYDVEAQQFLAESHYRNFEADKALNVLDQLGQQEPENHHVWAAMGYMALSLGQMERAESALQRYASIAPDLPHPWQLLGTLAMHKQNPALAMQHYSRALELEPGFAPARLGAAQASAYLGDYPSAKSRLRELLGDVDVAAKDRISAAFDLSALLRAERDFAAVEDVFADLGELLEQEKARVALALTERAYAAMGTGAYDSAQDLVKKAIERAPTEGVPTRYLFTRGLLELERGEFESVPVTVAAIRKHRLPADNPDQTEERAALLLEGLVLALQGQFDQGVKQLTQAQLTTGYEYRSVTFALAQTLADHGERPAALAASLQALRERPQFQAPEPRLDLEAERRRALKLGVQLACELDDARALAQMRLQAVPAWKVPVTCNNPRR